MRFFVDSKPLAYALNKCATVARPNATFPINRNVYIEATDAGLSILATDTLTTTVKYYVANTRITETGSALVDAQSLAAFVSARVNEIKVHTTDKNLIVKSGANRVMLRLSDGTLSGIETPLNEPIMQLSGEELSNVLSIGFLVNPEAPKLFMRGTYLNASNEHLYTMAATDGRLGYAWINLSHKQEGRFLLPQKASYQLPYFLHDDDHVDVHFWKNKIIFITDRFILSSPSVAEIDKYPAEVVERICSANQAHFITVRGTELMDILETCSVMTEGSKSGNIKKLELITDSEYRLLTIKTSEENHVGYMKWNIGIKKFEGSDFRFFLNSDFVQDIIKAIKKLSKSNLFMMDESTGLIQIGYSTETGTIYMTSGNLNAIFAIAPMVGTGVIEDE
jgi:DNA polymerase III sliding clamp (beta) subunit (PCNA family)